MGDRELEIHPGAGDEPFSFTPVPRGTVRTGLSGFIANLDGWWGASRASCSAWGRRRPLYHNPRDRRQHPGAGEQPQPHRGGQPRAAARGNRASAATTRQTSRLLSDNAGAIDRTLAAMPPLADDARSALARLESAAGQLERLAAEVRAGNGTAGRLVGDDEPTSAAAVTAQVDPSSPTSRRTQRNIFRSRCSNTETV
jgi:hypothetical protein